jgi:hypothetical protein
MDGLEAVHRIEAEFGVVRIRIKSGAAGEGDRRGVALEELALMPVGVGSIHFAGSIELRHLLRA